VPRYAGNHPRLTLGAIAAALVALAAGAGWLAVQPQARAEVEAVAEPLPPRPAVVAVESLPQLKAHLDGWAAENRFMGGVLVARGDAVLFRQVYGPANVAEGRPLELGARFRLASVSKQFTAAAILRLQDQGRLTTEDPLCKWINPCRDDWRVIRLKHLLSHTSGVPDLMARPGWGVRRVTPATVEELTADSMVYPLQFIPGSKVRYDNAAFNLLGDVVQRASGKPFATFLQDEFFDPLGMTDTGLGEDADGLAMGYANFPSGLAPQPQANVSIVFAAGALYSTLDDMLVWERALHGGHVLSADSYAAMIADHAPEDAPDERGRPRRDWGYGIFVNSLGRQVDPPFEDRQIYHTGSWSGFRNLVSYQPGEEVTVIVLSNNYHQRDQVFLITQQAMAEALGRPFPTALKR
jgi:CubicO group peptidase (beta-lactamase class C family)